MNPEEQIAQIYLSRLSRGVPKHEPDGKIPPDFSLASTIAVEVRRLNQNYFAGVAPEGLEEQAIPLERIFRRVLSSFDPKFDGQSYYVSISFKRPLPQRAHIVANDIASALDAFLQGSRRTPCVVQAGANIELKIHPRTLANYSLFRPAMTEDEDFGGMLVRMYSQNITHCIKEKAQKVHPYKTRYPEWWLLLVDTMMAWDLEPHEVDQLRSQVTVRGGFNKTIVIDHLGQRKLFEIPQ
jgi:hypothetical protein